MAARLHLVVPGCLDTRTGGFIYDRRIAKALTESGIEVRVHEVVAALPGTGQLGDEALEHALSRIGSGELVFIDGLAAGDHPTAIAAHAGRLSLVGLIHHPLALETGLEESERLRLEAQESIALAAFERVVCTSSHTARVIQDRFRVAAGKILVVPPGIDRPTGIRTPRAAPPWHLLCVATLTPRKGHTLLLQALAGLMDHAWHLRCIGSASHDAHTAAQVYAEAARQGLEDRVRFMGEVEPSTLQAAYAEADLFVLASHYEGYGMALSEALAWGIPVISSKVGAIVDTVPPSAGILVPAGDLQALRAALRRFMSDAETRSRLCSGARSAGDTLYSWDAAARLLVKALSAWGMMKPA